MKYIFIIFCVAFVLSTHAQDSSPIRLFFSTGINTTQELNSPNPGNESDTEFDVGGKRFAFLFKSVFMTKNRWFGAKIQTGFYTLGVNNSFYEGKIYGTDVTVKSKTRINYVLTAGPVFNIHTKIFDISLEPSVGLISGLSPDLTVSWDYPDRTETYSWKETNGKPDLSYMLGMSLTRAIHDKIMITLSTDYMMANSYRKTRFEDKTYYKNDGSTTSSVYSGSKQFETNKSGLVITAGVGFFIQSQTKETP